MPKYSVIIPVYNGQNVISYAIESLLKQDFKDYEIIVVDDGSTDCTKDVVSKYLKSGHVKYFYKENAGPGIARQYGLLQCCGDYICFLDADDTVYPQYFEVIEKHIDPSIDILEFEYDANFEKAYVEKNVLIEGNLLSHLLDPSVSHSLWRRVYRGSLMQDLEHVHYIASEDFFVNFQIFKKAKKMKCIKDVLYFYTENENSLTRNKDYFLLSKLHSIKVFELALSKYSDLSKEEKTQLHKFIVLYCLQLYYQSHADMKNYKQFAEDELRKNLSVSVFLSSPMRLQIKILLFLLSKEGFSKIMNYKNRNQL